MVARVRPDKVDLSGYEKLAALPKDLRRLAGQLRELTMMSTELEALPAWVGELSRLEVLRVGVKDPWRETCPIRELPASLGALTGLKTLDLGGCSGLRELPESLGALTGLRKLDLEGCKRLTELPASLGRSRGCMS